MSESAAPPIAPRVALWTGFIAVHAVLVLLGLFAPGRPLGDVDRVYLGWAGDAAAGTAFVGITTGFVYPILAAVPILAAFAFGPALYTVTWLGLVTVLDAVAFAALLGRGDNRRTGAAAAWWLAFLLLLGPVALGRIDSITVPLVILALLWVRTRPGWASVLLTVATWVKIWPIAALTALVLVSKDRWRILVAAAASTAVIVAVALGLGSGLNVLSFVGQQTERGIQIEAPIAGIWVWQAALRIPGSRLYYDQPLNTFQVVGAGSAAVSAMMTPLLVLVLATVLLLAWRRVRTGADWDRLFPALTLALVVTLIAVNKVGSPQYVTWLAAPVIVGLIACGRAWRAPAGLALATAALTQAFYPYLYDWLLVAYPPVVLALTIRNVLEFVLLGWAVREIWRSGPSPARAGVDARRRSLSEKE